jgi:hypothetical protein
MLTTLSIVSLDQGKIWREAHATPPQPEKPVDVPAPAPRSLSAVWLRILPALSAVQG